MILIEGFSVFCPIYGLNIDKQMQGDRVVLVCFCVAILPNDLEHLTVLLCRLGYICRMMRRPWTLQEEWTVVRLQSSSVSMHETRRLGANLVASGTECAWLCPWQEFYVREFGKVGSLKCAGEGCPQISAKEQFVLRGMVSCDWKLRMACYAQVIGLTRRGSSTMTPWQYGFFCCLGCL